MTPKLARLYIGAQIKSARLKSNLTQLQLATEIGVSRRCLISFEAGDRDVRLPLLFDIARITGARFLNLLPKEYIEL
ncbi:TPA: helix-turn-helix transcriptional regulator [Vibrio harveyi]